MTDREQRDEISELKTDIADLKVELEPSADYPREVVVDIRDYVDFNWDAGVKEAFSDYEIVDDVTGGKFASFLAAPHLYVTEQVYGVQGDDHPKPPQQTLTEGGLCYNQSIVLCSLYATLNIPTRKLKIISPNAAHSTVLVGANLADVHFTKAGLDVGLHEFYKANGIECPDYFQPEPDRARTISFSNDVRDEYTWFLADPTFSNFLGDDSHLDAKGYLATSTDKYWYRTTPHEIVLISQDSVYMTGEEGLKDLKSEFIDTQREFNKTVDQYEQLKQTKNGLSELRQTLTKFREASRRKRELTEKYEQARQAGNTSKAISLAGDINDTEDELVNRAQQINSLIADTPDSQLHQYFDPDEIKHIKELITDTVDKHLN